MKLITELHNKHKDKPIWIAGSGPSLDNYPDNYLDNKIAFTLHLAHVKYPNATYRYANEFDRVKWLKSNYPDYASKTNIYAYPFYKRNYQQVSELINLDYEKYYFLILRPKTSPNPDFVKEKVRQAKEGLAVDFGGYGVCLHACMYVAIMMGGNPINIIGSNHETVKGKDHYKEIDSTDKSMRPNTPPYTSYRGDYMKMGTKTIIEACKQNDITVNWIKNYEQTLHLDKKS